MKPKKLFVAVMALVLLQFVATVSLCGEDAPSLGKDEGLFKITFHLPPGTTAAGNYYYFAINAHIFDAANHETWPNKLFTMAPGSSDYTVYLPVKAAGGSGKAQALIWYTSSEVTGIITGYGCGTSTSPVSRDYWYPIKAGETCEINLEAIPGALVSGKVTLPASATPEDRMDLHFLSQTKEFYNCQWYTTLNPNADKRPIYYRLYLPKDMNFAINLDGVFGMFSRINESTTISTAHLGPEGLVHDIQIPEPRTVSFVDPYFEQMITASLKHANGTVYDYTVNQMNNLIIDDSLVKTLSDLSKLQSPTYVTIKNLKNFAPYQDWLNTLQIPPELTIDGNWKITDYRFLKTIKNCRSIKLLHVSPYADLSVLLDLDESIRLGTDGGFDDPFLGSGWGPDALKDHIALNLKARQILDSIIKPGMSDVQKELAIHDYIVAHTAYDWNTFNGITKSMTASVAAGSLITGLAMCGGYSQGFYLLANAAGIECRVVVGRATTPDGTSNHGWNMVKLAGEYYLVDTTWDDPNGSDPKSIGYRYFNVTSQELREDHSWVEADYPVCNATTYNYYNSLPKPSPVPVAAVVPALAQPFVTVSASSCISKFSNYYKSDKGIKDFLIGAYEITQAEWIALMRNNPSINKGKDLPVENVEWLDCIQYCITRSYREFLTPYYTIDAKKKTVKRNLKANGYRLPTDIEWEMAAIGGEKSKSFVYSGSNDAAAVAVGSTTQSAIGGSKGANELGICDMSGNVAEWCWDAETDIKAGISSPKESYGPAAAHLFRGGSYNSALESTAIGYRPSSVAESKQVIKGQRIVRNK